MRCHNRAVRLVCAGTIILVSILGRAAAQDAATAPPELRPPGDLHLILQAHASGAQIYECQAEAAGSPRYAWVLSGPDAKLHDEAGQEIGTHFAGPTWQHADGSQVKGKVVAQAVRDGKSIPWLLLVAIDHQGDGIMQKVLYIQRLNTEGGKAPAHGCDAGHAGKKTRVNYTADYLFYGR